MVSLSCRLGHFARAVSLLEGRISHLRKRRESGPCLGDTRGLGWHLGVQTKSMTAYGKASALAQGIRKQRRGAIAGLAGVIIAAVMVFALAQAGLGAAGAAAPRDLFHVVGFNFNQEELGTFAPTGSAVQTVTLLGQGTFSTSNGHGGWVQGAGAWAVDNGTTGVAIVSGSWTAYKLISWVSFGNTDPREEGGILLMAVHVYFWGGTKMVDATMNITCLNGHPPAWATEQSTLLGGPFNFTTLYNYDPSYPYLGFGINDFIPNIQGTGIGASSLELMAASRSSIGACHLGCC